MGFHPARSKLCAFHDLCRQPRVRHKLYIAYNTKCTHDNEFNNIEIVKKLVNTRMKIAQLLGYKDYAEYTLKKRMAENSDAVYKLLNQLLEAYTPTAQKEYLEVQELAREEQGDDFIVMPWDWSYYSNKLKTRNSISMKKCSVLTSNWNK